MINQFKTNHITVSQKKSSLPEGRPTQCGSWRHTKQPYVGRFFASHQDCWILALKFHFHYLYIIFSFVVILMKNFEIHIPNRYYQEETQELFSKFSVHIFLQETMLFAGKT